MRRRAAVKGTRGRCECSIPGVARPAVINASRARYAFAARWCDGKDVCDIGCGAAIGLPMLGPRASRLVGLDLSRQALALARRGASGTRFEAVAGDAESLPFAAATFDVVIAFEIVEHLERPESFLGEVARVLEPAGVFIASTPNRPVYSPRGTWLEYHRREYDIVEFRAFLEERFGDVSLYGQAHLPRDARLDCHPLNRFIYPLKRRVDPRGVLTNKLRAAYVYLRWREKPGDCSPGDFPVLPDGAERRPVLVAVCSKKATGKGERQ